MEAAGGQVSTRRGSTGKRLCLISCTKSRWNQSLSTVRSVVKIVFHSLSASKIRDKEREKERGRRRGGTETERCLLIIMSGICVCLSRIVINYLSPCRQTKQPLKSPQMLFSHQGEREGKNVLLWSLLFNRRKEES